MDEAERQKILAELQELYANQNNVSTVEATDSNVDNNSSVTTDVTDTTEYVTFGAARLPMIHTDEASKMYIPKSHEYIDNHRLLETLAVGINNKLAILLKGDTGVGKTSAIRYIASKVNAPLRRINMNGSTGVDEFVGKILLEKEGTIWIDGVLTDALRKGHWLVIDEVNAALPEILFVLHSLLDDDGYIVLSEKDGEIVRPHENFRIFATMNPTEGYNGTKDLNLAFKSRWTWTVQVDLPTEAEERRMIDTRYPKRKTINADKLKNMIKFANGLRAGYAKGTYELFVSPREMLAWVYTAELLNDITRAAELTLCNKTSKEEGEAIRDLLKLHFGLSVMDYVPNCKQGNRYAVGDKVVLSKAQQGAGTDNDADRPNVYILEVIEANLYDAKDTSNPDEVTDKERALNDVYKVKVIATNVADDKQDKDFGRKISSSTNVRLGRLYTVAYTGETA